jgi:PAS domain S-box-containing protein
MKNKIITLGIFGSFITTQIIFSQSLSQLNTLQFERISTESGLSQSSILCMLQDSKGFLWFGTYAGLNRYDGYQFKVYKNEIENPNSLSQNNVECIFEDRFGVLWVGTEDGLNAFDRVHEIFIHYKNDPGDSNSISSNYIRCIYEDRSGTIWIGTNAGGLNKFDREKKFFTRYMNDQNNSKSLSQNNVLSICEDSKSRLWIGTDGGLNIYEKKTNEFKHYFHNPNDPHSLSHNSIWRIIEDRHSQIWLATWGGGLNKYDEQTNDFITYQNNPADPNSLSDNVVRAIHEDQFGNLWVGTNTQGLDRLVPSGSGKAHEYFIHYQNEPIDPASLSGNSVLSIIEDHLGILWIGTSFNGINKYNPVKRKFELYKNRFGDNNSLSKNNVIATYEDSKGVLWIGTNGGGLNRFDRKKNQFTHYVNDPKNPNSISNNYVRSFCEDNEHRLWIGTENGLNRFDPVKQSFINFRTNPSDVNSISNNTTFSLYKDHSGNIWAGTISGLNKFDVKSGRFIRFNHEPDNPNSLSNDFIWDVQEDNKGFIWVGTLFGGLNRLDPKTNTFIHFESDIHNLNSISNNKVICLLEDKKGVLWIGTTDGLNRYDSKDQKFIHYSEKDGLPNNSIQSMVEDDHGNLWIGTNQGLSQFNPVTSKFRNFTSTYGLQSNEFSVNASSKLRSGEIAVGGVNGFNIFHPDSIDETSVLPSIVITDFQIFNKPVPVDEQVNGNIVLKRSITESDTITLSYFDNVFSFEFAALHFASPKDNQYAYMMTEFDKEWNYVGTKRTATYTNLDPGEYTFRVKASNNEGTWNEQGASIHIIITPPFWQTLWFKLIMALIVLSIAIFTYRRLVRARKLAEGHRIEQALAKERNLLRTLIDNAPDYVYVKDKEGHFIVGNSALVRQLGLSSENELLGKTDFNLFPLELAEKYVADEREILNSGKGIFEYEGPTIDENKELKDRWVSTTKVPFKDAQGNIIGTIGIGRDITERKRIEEEREILIQQLQTALSDVKTLSGLVPICSNCKNIRDDKGYWTQIESFIQKHSEAKFSHGMCPDCMAKLYPDIQIKMDKGKDAEK